MAPTPGTAQPGHQTGKQREAQRLGKDDRGPAISERGRRVAQFAVTRIDRPDRSRGGEGHRFRRLD